MMQAKRRTSLKQSNLNAEFGGNNRQLARSHVGVMYNMGSGKKRRGNRCQFHKSWGGGEPSRHYPNPVRAGEKYRARKLRDSKRGGNVGKSPYDGGEGYEKKKWCG